MSGATANDRKADQPERRQVRTKHTDADQLELFDGPDAQPRFYVDEDARGWS